MTVGRRISITFYSALALAIAAGGLEMSNGLSEPNPWLIGFFVTSGLAIVGVFFVYRWWALLPAITTVVAFWATGVIEHSEHTSGSAIVFPSEYLGPLVVLPIFIGIALLSVGLVARAIWEHFISPSLQSTASGSER